MHRRVSSFAFVVLAASAISACGGGGSSPTPPTLLVSGLGSSNGAKTATLSAATTYTLSATETASGGGSVTPGPLTITLSSATIGTVSGSSLTTGLVNASGTVTVTDSTTGLKATLAVTVLSTHPATAGDTITLAGKLTHTIARPLPAPSAVASPVTTVTNVTDVLKIASTVATFGLQTGLDDENVVETDAAPLQTLTTTSDTYDGFVASGSLQELFQFGTTSTDSNGVKDATTFGNGNGQLDELPDTNGATWTNTGAQVFAETEPDNTTVARTSNADGTYVETDTYLGGFPSTLQTNADLSASITSLGGASINVTYGAPAGGTIAYSLVFAPAYGLSPVTGLITDWFPTTTIYSDSFAKTTSQTIPSTCAVPATVGTTGTAVAETTTHLDTVLGTFEKRVQTVYNVPGFGSVCAVLGDTIDTYYDYTGQSQNTIVPGLDFAVASAPIQIDSLAETLGFTTGTVSGSSIARRSAQALPAQGVSTSEAFHAVTPIFDRAVEAVYRSTRDALARDLTKNRAALAKDSAR